MINPHNNEAYRRLNERYSAAFGDTLPLIMIPQGETLEGLTEIVERSIAAGRDLLPEHYGWQEDVLY